MFSELSLLNIVLDSFVLIVLIVLSLFVIPRTIYAGLIGLLVFIFSDYFSGIIGFKGLALFETFVSLFVIIGIMMDFQWGRDIFTDFILFLKNKTLFTITFAVATVIIGFFVMISFGIETFRLGLASILFFLLFFSLPRTFVLIIIYWFVTNAVSSLIGISNGMLYLCILYTITLILVTMAAALDLPERREINRLLF